LTATCNTENAGDRMDWHQQGSNISRASIVRTFMLHNVVVVLCTCCFNLLSTKPNIVNMISKTGDAIIYRIIS